ncbi:hypothetical protein MettiDRAFT_2613 [Methanolobus tindarius DSM 2278]|uniref:Uncharacterized protein n=1 Tax=Methanolobus tindarius DSM 2278 TaxID=1090322 RepID=W9DR20_METTI|nr:hypothetical protein MettiDRAFT_2613 [Methanolobus tindarius DSM 2278]
MIELIADILFITYLIILLIIAYKGFNISLLYKDNKYGLIVISIVLIYIVSAILTFLVIIYTPYKLGFNASVSNYSKFVIAMQLVISSTLAFLYPQES